MQLVMTRVPFCSTLGLAYGLGSWAGGGSILGFSDGNVGSLQGNGGYLSGNDCELLLGWDVAGTAYRMSLTAVAVVATYTWLPCP